MIKSASYADLSLNTAGQGQSGQAIKLFQTHLEISLTFHFDTSLILDDAKRAELSNSSVE